MIRAVYSIIFCLSFLFLILHLNFNVRSFRKSHELQELTLLLQSLQKDVDRLEMEYLSRTHLEHVYRIATEELGMVRQKQVHLFSNREVLAR